MAKPKDPDSPVSIASDPKRLKEIADSLDEVNAKTTELTDKQGAAAMIALEVIETLEKQSNLYQRLLEEKRKQIQLATTGSREEQDATSARIEREIEGIEKAKGIYEGSIKDRKKLLQGDLKEEIETYEKKKAAQIVSGRVRKDLVSKQTKDELKDLKKFVVGSGKAAMDGAKNLVSSAGPILTTLSVFKKDLTLDRVLNKMKREAAEFDDNYRDIVKATGLHSKGIHDAFTFAISPDHLDFEGIDKPMKNIGIHSKEAGLAMQDVLAGASAFRPSFMEANKETSAFTVNLVAGLKKIGVSQKDSVRGIDIFNKALGKTPDQASKAVRQLYSVANSLEIDVGKAFKDFGALMPTIAAYGDRAVEVFGELEAQARATGVAVGKLNEFAAGLDTFKGAAEVAQRFNAVLGDTFLSVTDLVEADPADKIGMIQQAMADAGISFEDADRRIKQVITSALGLKDTETAARIFGGKEEFEEAKEGLDMQEASQEKLTKRIQDSLTQAETLERGISKLGAGYRDFATRTRKLAVGGANAITRSFEKTADQTKVGEHHAIGMLTAFQGMSGAAGEFQNQLGPGLKQLKKLAVAFGAGGVASQIGQDVYDAASDKQKALLDNWGKDFAKNKTRIENMAKAIKKGMADDEADQKLKDARERRRRDLDQIKADNEGTRDAGEKSHMRGLTDSDKEQVAAIVAAVVGDWDAKRGRPADQAKVIRVYLGDREISEMVKTAVEGELEAAGR